MKNLTDFRKTEETGVDLTGYESRQTSKLKTTVL